MARAKALAAQVIRLERPIRQAAQLLALARGTMPCSRPRARLSLRRPTPTPTAAASVPEAAAAIFDGRRLSRAADGCAGVRRVEAGANARHVRACVSPPCGPPGRPGHGPSDASAASAVSLAPGSLVGDASRLLRGRGARVAGPSLADSLYGAAWRLPCSRAK